MKVYQIYINANSLLLVLYSVPQVLFLSIDNMFSVYFSAAPECDAGQWSCSAYKFNNTNCIPSHHRCDKEVDCHDQSDEQNCSKFKSN